MKQVLSKVADASQGAKHSAGCASVQLGRVGEMMIRGACCWGAKLVPEEGRMNADN